MSEIFVRIVTYTPVARQRPQTSSYAMAVARQWPVKQQLKSGVLCADCAEPI
jgi:hypothetical protein